MQISGFAGRFLVEIKVEYRGPGRYELAPEATRLWSYAPDSYLKTGEYRGSTTTTTGELILSRATGIGGDVEGEFRFVAQHIGGEARLGLTATVRSGRINRVMQLPFDP